MSTVFFGSALGHFAQTFGMRPWSNLFNLPIDKIAGRVYNGNFGRVGRARPTEYTTNGGYLSMGKMNKKNLPSLGDFSFINS